MKVASELMSMARLHTTMKRTTDDKTFSMHQSPLRNPNNQQRNLDIRRLEDCVAGETYSETGFSQQAKIQDAVFVRPLSAI